MNYLEHQYLNQISFSLDKFQKVTSDSYSFRCPFCGDSKKMRSKKRGSIFTKEDKTFYNCYNCSKSLTFMSFLQEIDVNVYNEYKLSVFKSKTSSTRTQRQEDDNILKKASSVDVEDRIKQNYLKNCKQISSIKPDDLLFDVKQYCINRKIPEEYFDRLYACDDINKLTSIIPKYKDSVYWQNSKMLVIPFFKSDNEYDYIQCRNLEGDVASYLRYITLEIKPDAIKLWGLDRIDWHKPIRVLEGPIDAMFVDNSLALAGASVTKAFDYITMRQLQETGKIDRSNIVVCFDHDYKSNKQVKDQLLARVDEGYSVLVYDKNFTTKDMNAIVLKGWSRHSLQEYILSRTFKGLRAKLELSKLSK